jgi:hypothetical protein
MLSLPHSLTRHGDAPVKGIRSTALAVLILAAQCGTASLAIERPSAQAACAAYDAHVLTLIEDFARDEADGDEVFASVMILARARSLCRDGRANEAIALYTSVEERLPRMVTWLR